MRYFATIILMLFSCLTFSQGFKIREFKQNVNDGSAFHAPLDAYGRPCGLIKVRSDNTDLQFSGDIIGGVENKMNEYWVYMTTGSKSLTILHPNYLPMQVNFVDFQISGLDSKATYILTLSEAKLNKDKSKLVIIVKPETATLFVDDVFVKNISGNGYYQLNLPKGDHICRIGQNGYRSVVQSVTTGKGAQSMSVELESVMADLELMCKTETAVIYIDGEKKGNGSWKGSVFPGDHTIEARSENFDTYYQTFSIAEKECKTLLIPELKRSKGRIKVSTIPANMPIIVDGMEVGLSPCTIDVESGKHFVSCKTYGIVPARSEVEVGAGKTNEVTLKILFDGEWLKDYYERAYNDNMNDVLFLASQACRTELYKEAVYWINRHPQGEMIVKYWYKYGAELNINAYYKCDWILVYSEIGDPEKALEIYYYWKDYSEQHHDFGFMAGLEMSYVGDSFFKKNEIDKAIRCYEQSGKDGFEGLGDCYLAKGNKQLAASYYRKCLNLDYYSYKNRVEKKLKEIE